MASDAPVIKIFTDGSFCDYKGLGFPCGWAAVFPDESAPNAPYIKSDYALNLMDSGSVEALAVIKALGSIDLGSNVLLYIDNQELAALVEHYASSAADKKLSIRQEYLEEGGNNRITQDRARLRELFDALDEHQVSALWVKGHQSNAHEIHYYNNMADKEARQARDQAYVLLDANAYAPQKRHR